MNTEWIRAIVIGLTLCVGVTAGDINDNSTDSNKSSDWHSHVRGEIERLKAAPSTEQVKKLHALLSEFVERSKQFAEKGKAAEAYDSLLAGQYIELAVRETTRADWGAWIIGPSVRQLQATLLYKDGKGLLQVLASPSIARVEKEMLVNMLEQAIRQETAWNIWGETQLLPKDLETKVRSLEAERDVLLAKASKVRGEERKKAIVDALDAFGAIAAAYLKAGQTAKAYQTLWTGYQLEAKEGLDGESGPLTYTVDEFRVRLIRNGSELLQVVHDKEIDLKCKMEIITELRTATSEGDFPTTIEPATRPN